MDISQIDESLVGKKISYDYSTSDVRLQALWQIIQEMGLI